MGRSQATAAASCGLPKRDKFMLSSTLCSRKRSAAESGGTGARLAEWLHSTGKRFDGDTALLQIVWAINAPLFDYRTDYRPSPYHRSRAIIEKQGDNRPTGDPFEQAVNVIGVKRGKVLSDRSLGYWSSVDSLNEFECQPPERWSYQQTRMAIGTDRRSPHIHERTGESWQVCTDQQIDPALSIKRDADETVPADGAQS